MATLTPIHEHDHHHHELVRNPRSPGFDILSPLRQLVDSIEVKDRNIAHLFCQLIPCCCPFERDVSLFGRVLFHIPALCKLNPLYNEFVFLRFRALSFLADVCGEDVTKYIC
ncbi:Mo-dependent nitrogenase C-terminal domain-containing protein [Microseira wollei]|uniref:Mo-dependent nitrogenase-like protein n=1 Tax=Microseira wollei NIES-4236 TaxID=2530354 RepID=A0AAV3X435_9CYAN|nr:Mo-dependent nitrogenase C-terminal domain-containing protein [Microseira wollei]GET36813.1 Mo-dependent nitrogenase-like protein [Microseira wollei NIES-4236]